MADLLMGMGIGDHRAGVHLGAGAHHGQHTAHRQGLAGRFLKTGVILLPGILVAVHRNGYRLGVIAHRAAADRQQQIGFMPPGSLHAPIELIHRGVGHDAGNLSHIFAVVLQNFDNLVINPVFLDRTAAIDQHDVFAVLRQFGVEAVQCVLAEIQLGRVTIRKIAKHENILLLSGFSKPFSLF